MHSTPSNSSVTTMVVRRLRWFSQSKVTSHFASCPEQRPKFLSAEWDLLSLAGITREDEAEGKLWDDMGRLFSPWFGNRRFHHGIKMGL